MKVDMAEVVSLLELGDVGVVQYHQSPDASPAAVVEELRGVVEELRGIRSSISSVAISVSILGILYALQNDFSSVRWPWQKKTSHAPSPA